MKRSVGYALIALSVCLLLLVSLPARRSRAQTHEDEPGLQGQPRSFGTDSIPERRWARNLTWQYLEDHKEEFQLERKNHMKLLRAWVDELAMAHVHVQQTFADVPVLGGEVIVHWHKDGTLSGVTNSWVSDLQVDTTPNLTTEQAVVAATGGRGCPDCVASPPEVALWVLRHEGTDRLAYRVQLRHDESSGNPSMPVSFVDAHTGEIFWEYDNLQTATGPSLYSGTVSFNTYFKSNTYYLEDLTRRIGTFDNRNGTSSSFPFTDTNDVWDSVSQRAALDVHYGTAMVLDYYKNVHGRDGLNGSGGPFLLTSADGVTPLVTSKVHYSSNYVNAFWNGQYMTYGDGDGSVAGPLVTIDIIGHEMTHGVTEHTAGLVYSGESGALNESWSDVFGAMIERYAKGDASGGGTGTGIVETDTTRSGHDIWKMGEECWTPANGTGDALRYMNDPHQANNSGYTADDDPDHYSERYTGSGDNGGVHINSGIANKAFYLLAQGGTHHRGGSMTGIGADDAARIWYKALTTYMTSNTNFATARTATINAANDLFGPDSAQTQAVQTAWCLVGVGQCAVNEVDEPVIPIQLQNGVPVTGLAGAAGSKKLYYLSVPAGASNLTFQMSGGTGDADMYVKFGSAPTTTSFDCRPYTNGNNERCDWSGPATGDWYVLIQGYSGYSGLTLTGTYTTSPPSDPFELIINGSFTGGSLPWVLSGASYISSSSSSRGGSGGHIYLGQNNNVTHTAYQQFTIPKLAESAWLLFYLSVTSQETTTSTQYDTLSVEVRNSSGALLAKLGTYSNVNKTSAVSYSRKGVSLLPYRGQTIRLQFRATSDSSLPTTFRVDDVSVK
jgi:Zn-dependent metalloprotease